MGTRRPGDTRRRPAGQGRRRLGVRRRDRRERGPVRVAGDGTAIEGAYPENERLSGSPSSRSRRATRHWSGRHVSPCASDARTRCGSSCTTRSPEPVNCEAPEGVRSKAPTTATTPSRALTFLRRRRGTLGAAAVTHLNHRIRPAEDRRSSRLGELARPQARSRLERKNGALPEADRSAPDRPRHRGSTVPLSAGELTQAGPDHERRSQEPALAEGV